MISGVDALQPVVPPAQALLEEADRGPGLAVLREGVRPRADQALARAGQPLDQARDGVRVAVRPAADRVDRRPRSRRSPRTPSPGASSRRGAGARARPRPSRACAPSARSQVSRQPSPTAAGSGGIGAERQHRRRPREHVDAEHAAADVVDVVGVAVVARAHRDDGLQRRRPPRRDLQPVEAAPRDADHADRRRCTTAARRATRSPRARRPAPAAGTRRAGCRRSRRCRAGRRARRRSRGRRSRGGGGSRARANASPLR